MTRTRFSLILAASLLGVATASQAADYDGSRDLLCAPSDVAQCDPSARCERVSAAEVDLPPFMRIQFGKKRLASVSGPERTTAIESVHLREGLTILQGAENGRAWSLVVDQATGSMTGSVTDGDGAFVVFGACTPQ